MTDIPHDPQIQRPVPNREALALAITDHRDHEDQISRYIRQQWEAATGANKVALDAWRRVWPGETRYHLPVELYEVAQEIDGHLAVAALLLDRLSPEMIGELADNVLNCTMDANDVREELGPELRPS